MKSLLLTNDEYEFIMKLRKSQKRKKNMNSKYKNFSSNLQKQLERQERNMRKIACSPPCP